MLDRLFKYSGEYDRVVQDYSELREVFEEMLIEAHPLGGEIDVYSASRNLEHEGKKVTLKVSIKGASIFPSQSCDEKRKHLRPLTLFIELQDSKSRIKLEQEMVATACISPEGVMVSTSGISVRAAEDITKEVKGIADLVKAS